MGADLLCSPIVPSQPYPISSLHDQRFLYGWPTHYILSGLYHRQQNDWFLTVLLHEYHSPPRVDIDIPPTMAGILVSANLHGVTSSSQHSRFENGSDTMLGFRKEKCREERERLE
eukprot:Gb_33910 [translate_table: standard]